MNATEGDTDAAEQANDEHGEGGRHEAAGGEVGERRHGAGASKLEPAGGTLQREADADAEERGADHPEGGVAREHVFGDVEAAAKGSGFVHDAEEQIKHDWKAEGGEYESAVAGGAEEFKAILADVEAQRADGVCAGDCCGDRENGGGHGGARWWGVAGFYVLRLAFFVFRSAWLVT